MAQVYPKEKNVDVNKRALFISHRELPLFSLLAAFAPSIHGELMSRYASILHIGWYHSRFSAPDWLDYVITTPGNIGSLALRKSRFVDVCSRDVLPSEFGISADESRDFDCVYVCNNSKNKRAREFFELSKAMPDLRFLLILSYPIGADPGKFDVELPEEIASYQKAMGGNSNLTFIDAVQSSEGYRLSRGEIASYLKRSKIYIHFCRREGESRSLGEAMACGCFLMAHEELVGGGNDILWESNSRRFGTGQQLVDQVRRVLAEGVDHLAQSAQYNKIRQDAVQLMTDLLGDCGLSSNDVDSFFDKDLSMFLPGHVPSQFKKDSGERNSDIQNAKDLRSFLEHFDIPYASWKLVPFSIALKFRTLFYKFVAKVKSRRVF